LKGEIRRKALWIASYLLVEGRSRHAIQFGKVAVDHHLLTTNNINPAGDTLYRDDRHTYVLRSMKMIPSAPATEFQKEPA